MKRPARPRPKTHATPVPWNAAASPASQTDVAHGNDDSDRKRLLEDFEKALDEDRGLTAEERDTAIRRYNDALNQKPVLLGAPTLDEIKENFRQAIDNMIDDDTVNASEREGLIEQMREALQAVDSEEVKVSYEYARRLEHDGPDKAAQWLAERMASTAAAAPEPSSEAVRTSRSPATATRRRRRQ